MTSRRGAYLASAGILGLVFLTGVLVGFAADRLVGSEAIAVERAEDREEERQNWIIERVDLTADQRTQVDSILDFYSAEMADLVGEYRPRYRTLVADTRQAIKAVLTPDQRERYEALLEARTRQERTNERGADGHR